MKRVILLILILSLSASTPGRASSSASGTVAFVNVNVIPLDKERVLQKQTVIVRDGTIVEIGDARNQDPKRRAKN
jgi:urease alpha subunit